MIEKVKEYWSPDQIAGYLKDLGIRMFYACAETIYRFIYSNERKELKLYSYLFKGRKHRRKAYSCKPRDNRVPEEYGIAFRPEIVKSRNTYGHWEGDLMIFARKEGSKSNVTSLIERKSRYTLLAKNDNRKPDAVARTIIDKLNDLPDDMTQTMTFDRGFEFMSYPPAPQETGHEFLLL